MKIKLKINDTVYEVPDVDPNIKLAELFESLSHALGDSKLECNNLAPDESTAFKLAGRFLTIEDLGKTPADLGIEEGASIEATPCKTNSSWPATADDVFLFSYFKLWRMKKDEMKKMRKEFDVLASKEAELTSLLHTLAGAESLPSLPKVKIPAREETQPTALEKTELKDKQAQAPSDNSLPQGHANDPKRKSLNALFRQAMLYTGSAQSGILPSRYEMEPRTTDINWLDVERKEKQMERLSEEPHVSRSGSPDRFFPRHQPSLDPSPMEQKESKLNGLKAGLIEMAKLLQQWNTVSAIEQCKTEKELIDVYKRTSWQDLLPAFEKAGNSLCEIEELCKQSEQEKNNSSFISNMPS